MPADADPAKLHPYFRELAERPGRAPARAVVKEVAPWLAPSDPHFVPEFQFKQFDQRLWELYLWAAFRELAPAPFTARCRGKLGDVAMGVVATVEGSARTLHDMIAIPGGTFRMGSDNHYPEEAPSAKLAFGQARSHRRPAWTPRHF